MLRRFFEWLFKKELKATEEIDLNAKCPRCGNRAYYMYSLEDQTMYNCSTCHYFYGRQFRLTPTSAMVEQN